MKPGSVVLLSGGQDSTTCLYYARKWGRPLVALSFDYGQRHHVELDSAREIAVQAAVDEHVVLSVPLADVARTALTDAGIDVPSPRDPALDAEGLPVTFVPGRNLVFLSLAAGLAYSRGVGRIVIGASAVDFAGYPDCRPTFLMTMGEAIRSGVGGGVVIEAPLVHLSKADTVRLARRLGDDCWRALSLSVTCYKGRPACGECSACVLRRKGFDTADERDPAAAA